jgi:hypothetical protein
MIRERAEQAHAPIGIINHAVILHLARPLVAYHLLRDYICDYRSGRRRWILGEGLQVGEDRDDGGGGGSGFAMLVPHIDQRVVVDVEDVDIAILPWGGICGVHHNLGRRRRRARRRGALGWKAGGGC